MDRAAATKKRKKLNKLRRKSGKSELQEETLQFDIPGVDRVQLSLDTQEAIGCIIGEDITPENPWTNVSKQRLLDVALLENSELQHLREAITYYPEDEIMLGYDPSLMNIKEQVFICVTVEAKQEVIDQIKKTKEEMYEKVKESLVKVPRKWTSLGSEVEVDGMVPKNFRPPIEVKVKSRFPLRDTSTKFSMRRMEDAPDGYVKLVSTRETFNYVTRKQVDAGAQAAPQMVSSEAQTNPTYPQNKWTQYSYKFEKKNTEFELTPEVLNSMKERADDLCEEIHVNEHIDYHSFDYSYRDRPMFRPLNIEIPRILTLQDVMSCKGKRVSGLVWHPNISGLLLTSYVEKHIFSVAYSSDAKKTADDKIHEKHLVLLWCYQDTLEPKLYLESHREVICVSFCEHDPNIIVGGCENGQVVIWDITGRLEEVEKKEMLTESEQRNRKIMYSLVGWMKLTAGAAWVQPTVVSSPVHSHSASITDISWLPQSYYITRNGKVEHQPDKVNLQFMTCGLDGLIHFWDLNSNPMSQKQGEHRRHGRLKSRPSALTLNVSWLKPLDKRFAPQFRLIVEDKYRFPMTRVVSVPPNYIYTPINKETVNIFEERTYYSHEFCDRDVFAQKIHVTTSTGEFLEVSWEGHDFDQGQMVNSEKCAIRMSTPVHDAPIRSCARSPLLENTILTVGGKIFILWNTKHMKALVWHSGDIEYVAGSWSSIVLNIVMLQRMDGYTELWNLNFSTCKPSLLVHLTSNLMLDLYTDNKRAHTRKNTVAITDNAGTIHILRVPDFSPCNISYDIHDIEKMLLARIQRKIKTMEWIAELRKKCKLNKQEKSDEIDEEAPESKDCVKKHVFDKSLPLDTFDKVLTQKWDSPQEKEMYTTLLKRNRLNLKEISQKSHLVREKRHERRMFLEKQARKIDEKETNFTKEKNSLYDHPISQPKTNIKLDDAAEKNLLEMKKSCVANYYSLEEEYRVKLEKRHFHLAKCDWAGLNTKFKYRRSSMHRAYSKVNLHVQRYEQEVLNKQIPEIKRLSLYASRIVSFDDDESVSYTESKEMKSENEQEMESTEEQ